MPLEQPPSKPPPPQRTPQHAAMAAEIELGLESARDPENAALPPLAIRTTTIYSRWYTQKCPECGYKFREGDRVRLCPKCDQAFHDDAQFDLHCWQTRFTDGGMCRPAPRDTRFKRSARPDCDFQWAPDADHPPDSRTPERPNRSYRLTEQFVAGIEEQWQAHGDAHVVEVGPKDPMLRQDCPWCGFKIRPGDRVVACPCGCGAYFHDDIHRHLTCWNDWNGPKGRDYCTISGKRIDRPAEPHDR